MTAGPHWGDRYFGELYLALASGFDPARIYMHGNNKTPLELALALESGVGRVVVDSFDELELHLAFEKHEAVERDGSVEECENLWVVGMPLNDPVERRRVSGRSMPGDETSSTYSPSIGSSASNAVEIAWLSRAQSSTSIVPSGFSAITCSGIGIDGQKRKSGYHPKASPP